MASSDVRVCPVLLLAVQELAAEFGSGGAPLDLTSHEERLARTHGAWAAWPLDAKFAFHVIAWLRGPGFYHAGLRGSVDGPAPDFNRAAVEVVGLTNAGHCGVIALHDRAARALRNAGAVLAQNLRPDVLYYPLGL